MKHPLDKYPVEYIPRSQIKEHPLNPREITPANKKRLKSSLTKNGLLDVLTWNKRTGLLLSGHQRLSGLDATATGEYDVPVMVVDFDESQEKAALIAMNNEQAQGDWDFGQLAELVKGLSSEHLEATAFDPATLHAVFGAEVTGVFPEVVQKLEESKAKLNAVRDKNKDNTIAAGEELRVSGEARLNGEQVELSDRAKELQSQDRSFMIGMVFIDRGERDAALKLLGVIDPGPELQFVDGRMVMELVSTQKQ